MIGDVTIMIYSIIALAVIAILFGGLFFVYGIGHILSPEKYNLQAVNPSIRTFETIRYYLDTKISLDGKELTLNKAFPLYCYNKDVALLEEIKTKTRKLSLESPDIDITRIDLYCIDESIKCSKENLLFHESISILLSSAAEDPIEYPFIDLPQLDKKTHVCLSIG